MPEKFDQNKYMADWKKQNMLRVSAAYKKEFVTEFRKACEKLGLKQSDVFRDAMTAIIEKAKEQ